MPISREGRVIYYVGPVDAIKGEAVGPAGPTMALRMDPFAGITLGHGLLSMIGKAERGPQVIEEIHRHGAIYSIAIGGAAVLVSKAIRSSCLLAFADLGMEAIREFDGQEHAGDGCGFHQRRLCAHTRPGTMARAARTGVSCCDHQVGTTGSACCSHPLGWRCALCGLGVRLRVALTNQRTAPISVLHAPRKR